jgi:hypothetical protein
MTNLIKGIISTFGGGETKKNSDFSDFFTKSSGDKAKVIRQVLREANEEQRKEVIKYREQLKAN